MYGFYIFRLDMCFGSLVIFYIMSRYELCPTGNITEDRFVTIIQKLGEWRKIMEDIAF